MKKLLIIRHAKSDWNDPHMADFDRPLNARGEVNAPEMADRLLKKGLKPQLIVSSPANRAISTAMLFNKVLKLGKKNIIKESNIYEASSSDLLNIIGSFDDKYDFIALVGHNPGLTDLVLKLCHCDIYNIPTCGNVLLEFDFNEWKMVKKTPGKILFYDYPKRPATELTNLIHLSR